MTISGGGKGELGEDRAKLHKNREKSHTTPKTRTEPKLNTSRTELTGAAATLALRRCAV